MHRLVHVIAQKRKDFFIFMNNVIKAAVDMGYSSVKASIDGQFVFQPSVIAPRPSYLPDDPEDANDFNFNTLLDNLDVTVLSPSCPGMSDRTFVGTKAVDSALPLTSMSLSSKRSKYSSNLPVYITLALIAARKLQEAAASGEVPRDLSCEVVMATALPVSEGAKRSVREEYAGRFGKVHHTVIFHNFLDPITVRIKFTKVAVLQEGAAGQLFLTNHKSELLPSVQADLEKTYGPEMAQAASEILDQKNTMTIDIGQGTTDFVVGLNGKLVQNASLSLNQGYGTVLTSARAALDDFDSNQELIAYLNKKMPSYKKAAQDDVKRIVYEQLSPLTAQIASSTEAVASHASVNRQVDVIYVFGGGSIPLDKQSNLRSVLVKTASDFGLGPVVFISPKYAQKFNLLGLEIYLNHVK